MFRRVFIFYLIQSPLKVSAFVWELPWQIDQFWIGFKEEPSHTLSPHICPVCSYDYELVDHLLIHCTVAASILSCYSMLLMYSGSYQLRLKTLLGNGIGAALERDDGLLGWGNPCS